MGWKRVTTGVYESTDGRWRASIDWDHYERESSRQWGLYRSDREGWRYQSRWPTLKNAKAAAR